MMTFRSETPALWDGTVEGAKTLPDAYLAGCLKRMARCGASLRDEEQRREKILVAEARARGTIKNMTWAMNRLCPPPCHCGKVGLYIVGTETFCREHRQEGANKRFAIDKKLYTPRAKAISADIREREQVLDKAKAHHKACGQRKGSSPGSRA